MVGGWWCYVSPPLTSCLTFPPPRPFLSHSLTLPTSSFLLHLPLSSRFLLCLSKKKNLLQLSPYLPLSMFQPSLFYFTLLSFLKYSTYLHLPSLPLYSVTFMHPPSLHINFPFYFHQCAQFHLANLPPFPSSPLSPDFLLNNSFLYNFLSR